MKMGCAWFVFYAGLGSSNINMPVGCEFSVLELSGEILLEAGSLFDCLWVLF